MPIGKPNAQTIASKKYQDKVGYIAKTYKLKRELVEQFADTSYFPLGRYGFA